MKEAVLKNGVSLRRNFTVPTHFVSDASGVRIQASLYQDVNPKVWVPINHTRMPLDFRYIANFLV